MIAEDKVELAVLYLRDSAKRYGQLRGHMEYCESNLRRTKALVMVELAGTLGEREAKAYASADYLKAMEAHRDATAGYEEVRALREAATFTIDVWRSQNSTRKQGHV